MTAFIKVLWGPKRLAIYMEKRSPLISWLDEVGEGQQLAVSFFKSQRR